MLKILIVDDSKFMRSSIRRILEKNLFEIVGEAGNGQEAVQKCRKLRPDLITMDITMPIMDGVEAVKTIKKFDKDVKIVMCSAIGQQVMIVDAIKSGASDFIVKPFQEQKVISAIGNVLGDLKVNYILKKLGYKDEGI